MNRGRFALALVVPLLLSSSCASGTPNHGPPAPSPPTSAIARAFLETALDTIAGVTLGRDTIPWRQIRDSALTVASGAETPSDTYGAIDWALRRANPHSFLQARRPGVTTRVVRGKIGYVHVPQRGGAAVPLADSLHSSIRALADVPVCGWIVDLRANGGGNMWPMLAGIGPLLGDSVVGSFGTGPGTDGWYYARGIAGLRHADGRIDTVSRVTVPPLPMHSAPVAVLHDTGTGSSGEALAVAFRGRSEARSFGSRTAGFATVNRGSRLPDGANMVVTTGYYADRTGREYPGYVEPDSTIHAAATDWPFPTDIVASAAADWLQSRRSCVEGGAAAIRELSTSQIRHRVGWQRIVERLDNEFGRSE